MEQILNINSILLALTGTGLIGTSVKLYKAIKNNMMEQEKRFYNLENGLQSMLKDRLYAACKVALETGYITTNELKNINAMYENYCNLGGNSFIPELYEKVLALKIVKGGF